MKPTWTKVYGPPFDYHKQAARLTPVQAIPIGFDPPDFYANLPKYLAQHEAAHQANLVRQAVKALADSLLNYEKPPPPAPKNF